MTDTLAASAATSVGTVVSLTLLWVLVAWLWIDYRVDRFRHRLFVIRAELFDIALRGDIAFDNPAYAKLRTTLNGFLRFADRVGYLMLVTTNWMTRHELRRADAAGRNPAAEWNETWERCLEELGPDVRAELNGLRAAMHHEVIEQIVFSSPLLTMTMIPFVVWFAIKAVGTKLFTPVARWMGRRASSAARRTFLDPLDLAAYRVGADDSSGMLAAA